MPWVKLDDAMPKHPKVLHLRDRAFRAHIEAICYSAHYLTDGLIETEVARREGWTRDALALVEAGVWEETGTGWRIHDYLAYNPSREQVLRERAQVKRRVSRFRNAVTSGVTNAAPDPHPDPVPDPQERDPDQKPPTPLRVEFWNRACELRGLLSLNASDSSLLDSWIVHGVTVAVWDEVGREIAAWDTPPDHPWGAFKSAMGAWVARGAAPRQLRAVPELPHERTEAQRADEEFVVEYKRIIRSEGVEAARRWAERGVTA